MFDFVFRARTAQSCANGRINHKLVAALLSEVLAAVLILSQATVTTAKNWIAGTGNWNVPGNWSPASVPTAGEQVNIDFTDGVARTVTYNVSAPSLGLLSVDLTGAGTTASTLSMPNNNSLSANGILVGGYNGVGVTSGRGALIQSAGTTTTNPGWDFVVGHGAGSTGVYTLSGGALVANQGEFVGISGAGTFNHTGGTNTINSNAVGKLFVGTNVGSTGVYNLSGTGMLTSNVIEYVGYSGTGTFTQTGGAHTVGTVAVNRDLHLGFNSNSNGTYTLDGGGVSLTVNGNEYVGFNGNGTFNQMGGTHSAPVLDVGAGAGSSGTFNLSGGSVAVSTLYLGTGGGGGQPGSTGTFNQTGGTVTLAGSLVLGGDAGTSGAYIQTGGNNTVGGGISVGTGPGGGGSYTLGGTATLTANTLSVGWVSSFGQTGSFSQTGGTNSVTALGINGGAYSLSGGTSTIGVVTISSDPGTFSQTGGTNSVTTLAINKGAYILNGGTLRFDSYSRAATGTFNFITGTIQLPGNRSVGTDAGIADLFGASPTISMAKGLTVEGIATLTKSVTLDGGTFSASQIVNASLLDLRRGTFNLTNQAVTIGSGGPFGSAFDVNEDMTVNVTLGITNQGLVTGDGQFGGTFTNAAAGEIRAQAGRSLTFTGSGNTNAGQIKLYGGELEFTQNLTNNAGAFVSGNGSLLTGGLTNHGTMSFAGTANLVGDVTNSASGKITSGGGGATIFYDDVINNGEIRTSANGFTVFFGSVSGSGNFTGTGTVNFEGDLSPGSSPAAVNFAGDVVLGPDSTLQIELGGTTPGSQYDQISVAGELTLDGTLEISLINGFTPTAGQTFEFLNSAGLAGAFASLQLPDLPGLVWNTTQLASGMLSVALAGDYNGNGAVDAADYVLWRKNPNSFPAGAYDTWRAHFSQTAGSGTGVSSNAAVPEPATLALLLLAAAYVCKQRLGRTYQKLDRV